MKHKKYRFKLIDYDKDNNLYCEIYRHNETTNGQDCKLKGTYKFDECKFRIIYTAEGWLPSHLSLVKTMIKEYEWEI